jgi:hypothetical protein
MCRTGIKTWSGTLALFLGLLSVSLTGCQTTVGGQTLPSSDFLSDDVQYFPAGPEELLPNQMQALEQYELGDRGGP